MANSNRVAIEDLGGAIARELTVYGKNVQKAVNKAGKKAIKEYSGLNSSGTRYLAPRAWALKLMFESTMPFGLPVVPPEYIITASSSEFTLACGLPINLLALA